VNELIGIGRFRFHDGSLEEFKRLSAQVMEIVRTTDTGTLQYDIYFNDDQSESIVIERYKDASALMEHADHVGHLMEAIFATGWVSSEMLGDPSAEIRATIAEGEVRLFTPFLPLQVTPPSFPRQLGISGMPRSLTVFMMTEGHGTSIERFFHAQSRRTNRIRTSGSFGLERCTNA
jgi:quinol monooxygenase YgiN